MNAFVGLWLIAMLVLAAAPLPAQDVPPEVIAKNLAENVLGRGTVKSVRVSSAGRFVEITWDAVLYKATNSRDTNRDQVRGEAELATGSIMGVMRPESIRYTILLGERVIATGRRTRDGGFTITFSRELGG
jgi:hypothetical protein